MADAARRGWRGRIEPGLYRAHRLACPSSRDQRGGRRCGCPWQLVVPGAPSPSPIARHVNRRRSLTSPATACAPGSAPQEHTTENRGVSSSNLGPAILGKP